LDFLGFVGESPSRYVVLTDPTSAHWGVANDINCGRMAATCCV